MAKAVIFSFVDSDIANQAVEKLASYGIQQNRIQVLGSDLSPNFLQQQFTGVGTPTEKISEYLSMIEQGGRVVILLLSDEQAAQVAVAMESVRYRGARADYTPMLVSWLEFDEGLKGIGSRFGGIPGPEETDYTSDAPAGDPIVDPPDPTKLSGLGGLGGSGGGDFGIG